MRRSSTDKPDAGVRAEMAGQIASTQAQLESNIEELRRAVVAGGDAWALGQAEAQLGRLGALARRLEHAGPGAIAALKAEVLAAGFAAQALGQQARTAAATAQTTEAALHAAQAEAHKTVDDFTRDFYERKIFEKDLRFASGEDERAYREREEQRRRAIEKAQAEGTPEGELRAANLAIAQMEDAGAHGATANPAYRATMDGLKGSKAGLEKAMAGAATERAQRAAAADAEASVELPPQLVASFRATGTVVADQNAQGHGVAARGEDRSRASERG